MEELSKRIKGYEKFIISLLVMVAMFFVCKKFVYQRQLDKRDRLQNELNTANYQYDLQEENKRQVENIEKEFKKYKERLVEIREDYPPVMQYEELMFLYQDFMNKIPYNFNGVSLSLYNAIKGPSVSSEDLVRNITDKDVLEKAYEMGFVTDTEEYRFQDATLADGSAYSANYSVTITGPMEKVWAFMDLMRRYRPKIAMTSFSLTGHDDGTVTAPISFSILGIMDKHVVGYSMLDKDYWKRTAISGKDNLFINTQTTGEELKQNLSNYTYEKADFRMRLIPYTEGVTPSTVMLEIANPKEEQEIRPQVYGNDSGISEVDIYVEEKKGKYFAKIRTQDEAYPDEKYENTIEFVPNMDNLFMYVLSSERVNDKDVSGVRINVENNTDKKFIIKTKYDPEDNPRVTLVEKNVDEEDKKEEKNIDEKNTEEKTTEENTTEENTTEENTTEEKTTEENTTEEKTTEENTTEEDATEENTEEDVTEEKKEEDVTEEKKEEDVTEEKKEEKKVTEEKKEEKKVTEEKKEEKKVTEEKNTIERARKREKKEPEKKNAVLLYRDD